MKKNRLTAVDIKDIKTKIREPINTERQNPEDAGVRLGNLIPEQVENTIEQVRQGKGINDINQPVQQEERLKENETFVVDNKETIEEIKIKILQEFFKTKSINIDNNSHF